MNQPHPDQRYGNVTYAQHGDDLMLLAIFDRLGVKKPFYVDIGAHHPSIISNTKLLYDRGSSGVNVDPSSYAIKVFNAERPRDQNLQVAIGPAEGIFDFYMYGERSGRNTLSLDEVESLKGVLKVQETRKVHVITYAQLIQNYVKRTPDLLLIDAEGLDYAILESIDFKTLGYPLVLCVETRVKDTMKMTRLLARSYTGYCRMGENMFFIRDDKFGGVMGLPETQGEDEDDTEDFSKYARS